MSIILNAKHISYFKSRTTRSTSSLTHTRRGYTVFATEGEIMRDCMDVDAVTKRLRRIEGQIKGIIKMVEDDKPCEDILVQIGAAKSALHKTGQVILEGHMHHCVLDAIKDGNEEETLKKLTAAIEQFSRIV